MNLFASLKETLTEELIGQIAQQNNEKPEKVSKAMDALSASAVGGILKRVMTESGMNLVFNQVQKMEYQSNITPLSAEWNELKEAGEKNLNSLLPGLKSSITMMTAKYAGTRNSLVSSLASIAISFVMITLKKHVTEKKMDAPTLAAFLGDQREPLLNVVPDLNETLLETLGIQSLLQNFVVPRIEQSGEIANAATSQPFLVWYLGQ